VPVILATEARSWPACGPRQQPFRCWIAVRTMSTRESGSSTRSAGTSWIRSAARSAMTATNRLKPRWAPENFAPHIVEEQIVAAQVEFTLRPMHHPGRAASREPIAIRNDPKSSAGEAVAAPRCRSKIDVQVGHNSVGGDPCAAQRAAAALRVQVDHRHVGQLVGQPVGPPPACDRCWRGGDGDPRPVRHLGGQEPMEPMHATRQVIFLGADREHDAPLFRISAKLVHV
jgi:hypothetical protein